MSRVLNEVNNDIHRLKKQSKNLKVQLVGKLSDKDYKTKVNSPDQNAISLFYQKDHLLYQHQKT